MIRIENLYKRFRKFTALQAIDAVFEKGQVVSLVGPNGSGKTTLIKSILGLVRPDAGTIYFAGKSIAHEVAYRNQIGYMPQIGRYPDNMRVDQLFRMIRDIRQAQLPIDETLYRQFGLEAIANKTMRSLSGGTRQKVSAALAFLFQPEVLILDEPTAGLDPLSTEILKDKIMEAKSKGRLILITTHVLADLEDLATHVLYLHEGRIVFHQSVAQLQQETGEEKLGRMITHKVKQSLSAGVLTA